MQYLRWSLGLDKNQKIPDIDDRFLQYVGQTEVDEESNWLKTLSYIVPFLLIEWLPALLREATLSFNVWLHQKWESFLDRLPLDKNPDLILLTIIPGILWLVFKIPALVGQLLLEVLMASLQSYTYWLHNFWQLHDEIWGKEKNGNPNDNLFMTVLIYLCIILVVGALIYFGAPLILGTSSLVWLFQMVITPIAMVAAPSVVSQLVKYFNKEESSQIVDNTKVQEYKMNLKLNLEQGNLRKAYQDLLRLQGKVDQSTVGQRLFSIIDLLLDEANDYYEKNKNHLDQNVCESLKEIVSLGNAVDDAYTKKASALNTKLLNAFALNANITLAPPIEANEIVKKSKENIGSGIFGTVYLAKYNGNTVAIKEFIPAEGGDLTEIVNFNILNQEERKNKIGAQYIIKYFGYFYSNENTSIIMEYATQGDLFDYYEGYKDKNLQIPCEQILKIMQQVLQGLQFIHGCELIHCDLKPENILLTKTDADSEQVRITDFGLSKQANENEGVDGTLQYIHKERLNGSKRLSVKDDIYAFMLIFNELCYLQEAYDSYDDTKLIKQAIEEEEDPFINNNLDSEDTRWILSNVVNQAAGRADARFWASPIENIPTLEALQYIISGFTKVQEDVTFELMIENLKKNDLIKVHRALYIHLYDKKPPAVPKSLDESVFRLSEEALNNFARIDVKKRVNTFYSFYIYMAYLIFCDKFDGIDNAQERKKQLCINLFKVWPNIPSHLITTASVADLEKFYQFQYENHYDYKQYLGQGGCSIVYRRQDAQWGMVAEKKRINKDAEHHLYSILNDLFFTVILKEQTIQLFCISPKPSLTIIMQCGEKSLGNASDITLVNLLTYMLQVMSAVEYLHGKGVVHRDIKPENILLVQSSDSGLEAKLIDFGSACPHANNDVGKSPFQEDCMTTARFVRQSYLQDPKNADLKQVDIDCLERSFVEMSIKMDTGLGKPLLYQFISEQSAIDVFRKVVIRYVNNGGHDPYQDDSKSTQKMQYTLGKMQGVGVSSDLAQYALYSFNPDTDNSKNHTLEDLKQRTQNELKRFITLSV